MICASLCGEEILIELNFLSSMEAIDGIVIDLGLDWEKFENKWKEKFFDGVKNDEKNH